NFSCPPDWYAYD
nr:RecName: Full=Snaclec alboluxin subunit beta [Trimeresurus albolabris]